MGPIATELESKILWLHTQFVLLSTRTSALVHILLLY